jgi:hypothetical protein
MNVKTFNKLLDLVAPLITKQDTAMRPAISAKVRLQVSFATPTTGEAFVV